MALVSRARVGFGELFGLDLAVLAILFAWVMVIRSCTPRFWHGKLWEVDLDAPSPAKMTTTITKSECCRVLVLRSNLHGLELRSQLFQVVEYLNDVDRSCQKNIWRCLGLLDSAKGQKNPNGKRPDSRVKNAICNSAIASSVRQSSTFFSIGPKYWSGSTMRDNGTETTAKTASKRKTKN